MTISTPAIILRSPRRVRLVFATPLAPGAYDPTLWAVACTDGSGAGPTVNAVFLVSGSPCGIELALSCDLVDAGSYQVTGTAIPALDASTWTGVAVWRQSEAAPAPSPQLSISQVDDALFGTDLAWENDDHAETADGDLDIVSGMPNAKSAILRLWDSEGLPWAPNYGGHPREYVDGSPRALPGLLTRIQSQTLADDRVEAMSAAVAPSDVGTGVISADVTFIGGVQDQLQQEVRVA